MIAVLPAVAVPTAIATLGAHGVAALVVGEVVEADENHGSRYVEGGLETIR